jgi:hypothetical protein
VEIKCQLDATDEVLLQILLLAQHVSGTFMPIISSSRLSYKWLLPVVFGAWFSSCRYSVELRAAARKPDTQPSTPHCTDNLKTKQWPQTGHTTLNSTLHRQLENQAPNTTDSNYLYNTLELLMMGIKVPETCWASNKSARKIHLLHLVGILFPHN